MADYTEEQRVKRAYPEAICRDWSYGGSGPFTIMTFAGSEAKIISRGVWTEAEAWADASRRLGNEFVDEVGPLAERKEG